MYKGVSELAKDESIKIAEDFLKLAKEGKIKNVLIVSEHEDDYFRIAHNEMGIAHIAGMADVAKHMIFHPEDREKDE
jgi:hypothetical protein